MQGHGASTREVAAAALFAAAAAGGAPAAAGPDVEWTAGAAVSWRQHAELARGPGLWGRPNSRPQECTPRAALLQQEEGRGRATGAGTC